jgi:hypothetical protein
VKSVYVQLQQRVIAIGGHNIACNTPKTLPFKIHYISLYANDVVIIKST